MIRRCENPADKDYHNYGGRGISVCERWRDPKSGFANFLEDMDERSSAGHSIDRIDNGGNYEPTNCRWATQAEQNSNQRRTKLISYNGALVPLTDAYANSGISRAYRIRRGKNCRSPDHPHYLMLKHFRFKNATREQYQMVFDILLAIFQGGFIICEVYDETGGRRYIAFR